MNVLQEKQQYSLSTENKSNKSLFFVKLTDSALQSIETFIKSENNSQSKPTIQFENNNGIISLPSNDRIHNYKFTLSNIEGAALHSSFQCLKHTNDNSLESVGSLLMKMQIHAKEDSYEQTRVKMAAVDQEQKNSRTKEIKQGSTYLSLKSPVSNQKRLSFLKNNFEFRKPNPVTADNKSKLSERLGIKERPIRERIIHVLAIRPYQKPELLVRLSKEGISLVDKSKIGEVLTEVAKCKGNTFSLTDDLWSEVKEDWPFYSKEELQLLQRRKHQSSLPKPLINFVPESDIVSSILSSKKQKLFHDDNEISTPIITNGTPFSKKLKLIHDAGEISNPVTANGSFNAKQTLSHENSSKHSYEIVNNNSFVPNSVSKINSTNVNSNTLLPDTVKQNTGCNHKKRKRKNKSKKSKKKLTNGKFSKDIDTFLPDSLKQNINAINQMKEKSVVGFINGKFASYADTFQPEQKINCNGIDQSTKEKSVKLTNGKFLSGIEKLPEQNINSNGLEQATKEKSAVKLQNINCDGIEHTTKKKSVKLSNGKFGSDTEILLSEQNINGLEQTTKKTSVKLTNGLRNDIERLLPEHNINGLELATKEKSAFKLQNINCNGIEQTTKEKSVKLTNGLRNDIERLLPEQNINGLEQATKEKSAFKLQNINCNGIEQTTKEKSVKLTTGKFGSDIEMLLPEQNINGLEQSTKGKSAVKLRNINCNGIEQTTEKKSAAKLTNGKLRSDIEELIALHSSEWLNDKYFKKSKHLVPLHYIQPLPITCYPIQIGSDSGNLDFNVEIDCSEIVQKYPKITSAEQRTQFVEDFDLDYAEYLQLHSKMLDISKSFESLSNRLQASVKGSDEFRKIKREIAKMYRSTLKNSDYIPARKKYEFFKTKLSHIRRQVLEYDSSQNFNHESIEPIDISMEDCSSL